MTLPTELLQAISFPGGGKIALVLGAGCSVEAPTCLPTAREWSEEVHRRLIVDGVLQSGDCPNAGDLSLVTDAVFDKTGFQREVVERLLGIYDLKSASPNNGYILAAAMLSEGAISSLVTLNFDLAMSHAIALLGVGKRIGVIERPEDLNRRKSINIYYLHRNANAASPEEWVLRTDTLQNDWSNTWQPIVTTIVLTAPVVVFAGLGTPVTVLIESTKQLRRALPDTTNFYQVDPDDKASSKFFQELAIDSSNYIQRGWCQFMEELSQRLLTEHIVQLQRAVDLKFSEDRLPTEDVTILLSRLKAIGLVNFGKLRACWLLCDEDYCRVESTTLGLIADLLIALAMIARTSGTTAVIVEDGLVEFERDRRIVTTYIIASGSGHRSKSAIEARVESRRTRYLKFRTPPQGVLVGGTSDTWDSTLTPPTSILRGDVSEDDIVSGREEFPFFHINYLRNNLDNVHKVVL